MYTNSVSTNVPSAGAEETAARIPTKVLTQEDFLQLLVAKLTTQDPLNPEGDVDFMAQMTQFSSLENAQQMANEMRALRSEGSIGQANALLGRTVTLKNPDGTTSVGQVSSVRVDDGVPLILVNSRVYQLSQVQNIMPAPVPK
jgi:flagellar basal-body rod modification protein FlgD